MTVSRVEVPMPQMGESIAEGTVSKWLKAVGDTVERDEPILEISTDKVDAEIPSPSAGALAEILVAEGETVEVGTVVAYIEERGAAAVAAGATTPVSGTDSGPGARRTAASATMSAGTGETDRGRDAEAGGHGDDVACTATSEERLRTRSTPVVRRIAAEAGVDISRVAGTGHQGRVTKQDILAYIEASAAGGGATAPATPEAPTAGEDPHDARAASAGAAPVTTGQPPSIAPAAGTNDDLWHRFHREVEHPAFPVRDGDRVETMDKMRRLTAEHMVLAKRIAPHVHSIIEIDFGTVDRMRRQHRERWAKRGARVSYTAFVAWACARILRDFPAINGTISGENVIYRGAVNLGMAVDLNPGLIVPVIHDADDLSLVGTARKIVDLAERAKSRSLAPSEIQGATFTITNPGVLGTVVGMPVIPKGTSAILGTGAIEKRVVAVTDPATRDDYMAIRKRSYFSMGYDHRLVDGADCARFLATLKEVLEDFPEDA